MPITFVRILTSTLSESTPLSCSLADQGIKIRIRKDIRVRKRPPQAMEVPTPLPMQVPVPLGPVRVAEALVECLQELEAAHRAAMANPEFWKELRSHYAYMNRPSNIYLAESLTAKTGGAKIWLKREDL